MVDGYIFIRCSYFNQIERSEKNAADVISWGAHTSSRTKTKKRRTKEMMSFTEVIELDNQFDSFLFEGGNDPFGKESDDLLAPEEE